MKLFKFYLDCGRMGELEGIFAATEEEIDKAVGETVNFGEVLGKHSDISFRLEKDHFELLTGDQDFIKKATEYKLIPSGHNPLSYLEE